MNDDTEIKVNQLFSGESYIHKQKPQFVSVTVTPVIDSQLQLPMLDYNPIFSASSFVSLSENIIPSSLVQILISKAPKFFRFFCLNAQVSQV